MWYYFILQSRQSPSYFYRGTTDDLHAEVMQHSRGEVAATAARAPFKLVYYEAYITERAAKLREMSVRSSHHVLKPLMRRVEESMDAGIPVPTLD